MKCKVCGGSSPLVFRSLVLRKHDVAYHRCDTCDFMQTEEPYWLDEAYSSAISDLDLGPVNRAVTGARITETLILSAFDPNARFIDWGGGYGVFTRLMRDNGFDFWWHDPFCENLFAKQFRANLDSSYEMLTAFEVFEHLPKPMDEIERMFRLSPNIFFTTLLPPERLTDSQQWWYIAPEHGQHIAIYSLKTLGYIARKFEVHLTSDSTGMHLFSQNKVSDRLFRAIVRHRRATEFLRRINRRKIKTGSLLMSDFRAITGWKV